MKVIFLGSCVWMILTDEVLELLVGCILKRQAKQM